MAKDNRVVHSGAFTLGGVLTDPDAISEQLTAKEISNMVEVGALEGDWHSLRVLELKEPNNSQTRIDDQAREIAALRKQLEDSKRLAQSAAGAVSPVVAPTKENDSVLAANKGGK